MDDSSARVRLTPAQEDALVAAVNWPPDSPAYGVIRRSGKGVRALTETGLMSLRQKGLVGEWRTVDRVPGSEVVGVRLNERGIALGQAAARRRNPEWRPESPQYQPSTSSDAIDWSVQ